MSATSIDVLPSISMTAGHAEAGSPPHSGGRPAPESLLDDWENWPENDPRYDPAFDGAWPLRKEFCECKGPECEFCSETREVFHVSEYTADGQTVMDDKVNTKELHNHLKELERLDKSKNKSSDHPAVRLFFACGNYGRHAPKYNYMRHFLAYCRIPPHFVLRRNDNSCIPTFQAAYESPGMRDSPSENQRGILHIYLQIYCLIGAGDILANSEYYSKAFEPKFRGWVEGAPFSPLTPTLYIRYNESSRDGAIHAADSARTFHSLRDIFSSGMGGANQDPFLLVAVFLQHRIAEAHKFLAFKLSGVNIAEVQVRKLSSLDRDAAGLFNQIDHLASGQIIARMGREVSSMLRALQAIEAEHQLFCARDGDPDCQGEAARMIRLQFKRQRAQLLELESAFAACMKSIEIVKDMMIGRAQILNGIEMAKMTKDNQKQAEATEALALDARRDSEIMKRDSATMKTITVVTLVYLPATFVSTLLSMGLFDFGVGSDGDGRLRIAREGWVFLAISLPLTLLTLGLAYLWKQSKEREWGRDAAKAETEAAAAKQEQEKSAAADGNAAAHLPPPETAAVETAAVGDAAPPSLRQRLLAKLPNWRRAPEKDEKMMTLPVTRSTG